MGKLTETEQRRAHSGNVCDGEKAGKANEVRWQNAPNDPDYSARKGEPSEVYGRFSILKIITLVTIYKRGKGAVVMKMSLSELMRAAQSQTTQLLPCGATTVFALGTHLFGCSNVGLGVLTQTHASGT